MNRINFISHTLGALAAAPLMGHIIPKTSQVPQIPDFGGGWKWEVELPSGAYEWRIVSVLPFTYKRFDDLRSRIDKNLLAQRSRVRLLDTHGVTRVTYHMMHRSNEA